MFDQPLLLTIDKSSLNAKSFNIYLSENFRSADNIKLYTDTADKNEIQTILTPNLSNNTDLSRTVQILDNAITLIPTHSYIIEIIRTDLVLTSASFTIPAISDYEIIVYGDRIITIKSKFPVQNWLSEANIPISDTESYPVLSNFYAIYYGRDTNTALTSGLEWGGFFPINDLTAISPEPFTARVSNNNMTLEIQSNLRGLPNTGSLPHKLIINYSKAQEALTENKQIDLTVVLLDLANNDLAIKEKDFFLVKYLEPSKAINIEIDSRDTITLSYDKQVCLISTELSNIITIDGKNYSADSAIRVGNTFNKISYHLNSKLPLGDNIQITVNSITDASGFKTQLTSPFRRNILGTPPKFESILHESSENNETILKVKFNTAMDTNSATNTDNYLLIDNGFESSLIKKLKSIKKISPDTFVMTTELLDIGSYKLSAIKNISNLEGYPMILPEYIDFYILDTVVPKIVDIYAPLSSLTLLNDDNSKIVILYDNIMSKDIATGANKSSNYRLDVYSAPVISPIDTCNNIATKQLLLKNISIDDIKDSKWFRIPLSTIRETLGTLKDTIRINIGYCGIDYIKHVTNTSGNIVPLCCKTQITSWLIDLDISNTNTKLNLISSTELKLIYPTGIYHSADYGYNYFTKIDRKDFQIVVNGLIYPSASVELQEDMKSIILKLSDNIPLTSRDIINVKTIENVQNTKDLFDNLIVSNVLSPIAINTMPPEIIGASLESIINDDEATLNLVFNNNLSNPSKTDFKVFNNGNQLIINSATIKSSNTNTVQLKVSTGDFDNSDNVNYTVSSIDNTTLIETGTINGLKINTFENETVNQYRIISLAWTPPAIDATNTYNLANISFLVKFSKPIDFNTINSTFTNDSYFINNVLITNTTAAEITGIDINFPNDNLGKVIISTSTTANIQGSSTNATIYKAGDDSIKILLSDNNIFINQMPRDARLIVDVNSNIMDTTNTLYLNKSYVPLSNT